ncbi:hypothetical protein AHAS_Ahas11G0287300 [Arachis hypogaea]
MSESMFMAAVLNYPKTSFKINPTPALPPPPTSSTLTFKPNNNIPILSVAAQPQQQEHTALLDTLLNSTRKNKCSNPSEPPPPSTTSSKQIFTIQFPPSPPKPGKRVHLIESLPQFPSRDRTQYITANAVVSTPDPNVTIAKKCYVFPVEFVARGFMTGSTILHYGQSTIKASGTIVAMSSRMIIERELMTRVDYEEVNRKVLSLFKYEHGFILVDTKYEFGKAEDGSIMLIDEVHTPDSSRGLPILILSAFKMV